MWISFPRRVSWLHVLIGVNVVLFIVPTVISVLLQSRVADVYSVFLYLLGGLNRAWVVGDGELWRMVTSMFLHIDAFHLVANMFALFQIGRIVEEYYGGKQLWTFYILSGLGGSALSVLFLGTASTVGASGAVFGLIGVLLAASLRSNPYSLDLPFRAVDIAPLALYAFLVGIIPNFPVNNWAHLGGFLVGAVCGYIFSHQLTTYRPHWVKVTENGLFWLCLVITAVAYLFMAISVWQRLTVIGAVI